MIYQVWQNGRVEDHKQIVAFAFVKLNEEKSEKADNELTTVIGSGHSTFTSK